ncbi:MAG: HAD hydrolase-like protein [Candidatus Micrarchaeota archaeon]|nr:HAD hydrolase-like protein [Candidatus Micrarchaeota archaeon]
MKISTVLFDWDNTLVNTNEFKELSKRAVIIGMQSEATEKFRIKLSRKVLEETMDKIRKEKGSNYGKLIDETALIVCRNLGINDQLKIDRIATAGISAHHKTKYAYFAYLYNEVIETLTALKSNGITIGIATAGMTHKQIDKINWANLNRLIDEIFVTEQYVNENKMQHSIEIKTKEYFLWIASKLNKDVKEIMMVGDSYSNDIEPSKDAGMITVHLNRKCNTEEVKGPKADFMVEELTQVTKIIWNL